MKARDAKTLLDPAYLSRLSNYKLLARLAVEGFLSGIHRSVFHGFGMEFLQYRSYTPGEDLKYLDWKVLARNDRLYTKVFEEETETDCLLLLDASASMDYQGSRASCTKLDYARMVAACLAYLATKQGDRPGLFAYDEHLRLAIPPRAHSGGFDAIARSLPGIEARGAARHAQMPVRIARHFRRRSIIVLLSDMLEAEEELPPILRGLSARGCDCIALQILDPDEVDLPKLDLTRFIDAESGRELIASPGSIRDAYDAGFAAYSEQLTGGLNSGRIDYCRILTNESIGQALAAFLRQRGRNR